MIFDRCDMFDGFDGNEGDRVGIFHMLIVIESVSDDLVIPRLPMQATRSAFDQEAAAAEKIGGYREVIERVVIMIGEMMGLAL